MSEASGFMVTRNDHRFESIQQWFVFVNPEADIDPETSLPDDPQDWCVVDVDELAQVGTPRFEDQEFEFWAVVDQNTGRVLHKRRMTELGLPF